MKKNILNSNGKWGMKLGLDRIKALLNELDNPQNKLKFIHIAGSNGKGSTAKILETALTDAGYTTGCYTSPAIVSLFERIRVNNEFIPEKEYLRIRSLVEAGRDELAKKNNYDLPTDFEIEVAIALLYFLEQNCDICIMEVGLGGRFDATNIIPSPEIAIITSLSLEHTKYLGDTITAIAQEKGGIIKEHTSVLTAPQDPLAAETLYFLACLKEADFFKEVEPEIVEKLKEDITGQTLQIEEFFNGEPFEFGLAGDYQRENLLLALEALEILKEKGFEINEESLLNSLRNVKFQGRLETISKEPLVVIDGAHNLDGIKKLTHSLKHFFKDTKVNLFFGMLSDKSIKKSVKLLDPLVESYNLLTPDSPEAVKAEDLGEIIRSVSSKPINILKDYEEIKENIREDIPNIVTGSLYLLGPARAVLTEKN